MQSTSFITPTTLALLIDKHGPDTLSCHIPAAPITKINVCYMTDVKSISDK